MPSTSRIAAAVAALAALAAAPAAAAKPRYTVLTVIEHADTNTTNDVATPGDSPGDILTYNNPVFDAADRKQVGTDLGWCIRIIAGDAWDCAWTTLLPGGQLMVQGPFYDTRGSQVAITGGTGKYAGARGFMKLRYREGGKKFVFEFHYRR